MADHRFPQSGPDGYVSPYSDIAYSKGPKVIYGDTDVMRLILNDPQVDDDDEWGRTEHIALRQLTDEAITVRKALFGWSTVVGLLDKWDYFETNHFGIDYATPADSILTIGNTSLSNGELQLVTGTKYTSSEFTMNSEYFKVFKVGTLGMKAQAGDNSGGAGDVVLYWYPAAVGDPDSTAAFRITVNGNDYNFTSTSFGIPSGASFSAGSVTFTSVTTDNMTVADRIIFSSGGVIYNNFCGTNFWLDSSDFRIGTGIYSTASLKPESLTFSDGSLFQAGLGFSNKIVLDPSSSVEIGLECPGFLLFKTSFGAYIGPTYTNATKITNSRMDFAGGQALISGVCPNSITADVYSFNVGTSGNVSRLGASSLNFQNNQVVLTEGATPDLNKLDLSVSSGLSLGVATDGCAFFLRAESSRFQVGSASNKSEMTATSLSFQQGLSLSDSSSVSSRRIVFDSSNSLELRPFCQGGFGLRNTTDRFAVGSSDYVVINSGVTLSNRSIDFGDGVVLQGDVCPNKLRVEADLFQVGSTPNQANISNNAIYLANSQGALTQNYVHVNATAGVPSSGTYSQLGSGTIRVFQNCAVWYLGVYTGSSWVSTTLS